MKISKLYLLTLLSVLSLGCRGETTPDDVDTTDTATAPELTTGSSGVDDGRPVLLFLGNSLSAGAGIDASDAFPDLIRRRIDSLGWNYQVVNAGLSGETTSGGLRRIDWLLRQPVDVLVLELGGNDGLRGIPVEVAEDNLRSIIRKTRETYPDVEIVLAGMQIPPNLGHDYTQRFREIYPRLAETEETHLIPFLLEGVGGVDSLMQGDGIHPTEAGHRIVAENVWETLRPVLEVERIEDARATSPPR